MQCSINYKEGSAEQTATWYWTEHRMRGQQDTVTLYTALHTHSLMVCYLHCLSKRWTFLPLFLLSDQTQNKIRTLSSHSVWGSPASIPTTSPASPPPRGQSAPGRSPVHLPLSSFHLPPLHRHHLRLEAFVQFPFSIWWGTDFPLEWQHNVTNGTNTLCYLIFCVQICVIMKPFNNIPQFNKKQAWSSILWFSTVYCRQFMYKVWITVFKQWKTHWWTCWWVVTLHRIT